MPPRIFTVLGRLRQDLASCLTPEAIKAVCRVEEHSWRERLLNPVTTIYLFLLQVLHGNTACQHVVHFGEWLFSASAYGQARKRLPLRVYHRLLEHVAEAARKTTADVSRWLGHRVWIVDGSSFSMPDVPELQSAFGQAGNQAPGCGFPIARWLALFDMTTGMLLRCATAPLRSHEMSRVTSLYDAPTVGDVVLGDRGFCSFAHLATLVSQGLHAVFRVHQRQIVDFTVGREFVPAGRNDNPKKLPRSRWVTALGKFDQIVIWIKPGNPPNWMTAEQFAALPEGLKVRELRYRIETPGYRTQEITLVTTLLDADAYPASALADLFYRRWQVELDFRHLKTTMKMDVLHCKTAAGVLKELAIFSLVYNLVRSVIAESARARGILPDRISFVDALRWLVAVELGGNLTVLLINPTRPGRVEPRVVKRRPKQYYLLTKPRSDLRKQLPIKGM